MLNLSARKVKSLNDISEVFKRGDYAESEVSKVSFDENIVKEHFKKLYQAKKDVFLSLRIDLQSKDIEQSDSNISDMHEKNEEKELQKLKESKVNEDDRVKRVSKVILFYILPTKRDSWWIFYLAFWLNFLIRSILSIENWRKRNEFYQGSTFFCRLILLLRWSSAFGKEHGRWWTFIKISKFKFV